MKDNQFKIDIKKRNIIISVIMAILIIVGIIIGVVLFNRNNKPTAEPTTETTEVEEQTEDPTEDETKTVKDTEESVSAEESEDTENTENTENTEKPVTSTEETRHTSDTTQQVRNTEEPATQAHTHTWSEATCTTPKTCTTCGVTEGSALGHDYKDHEETIHHPAEWRDANKCHDCGAIYYTASEMDAHQSAEGHCGYGSCSVKISDAWDEIIHKWICSRCGASK